MSESIPGGIAREAIAEEPMARGDFHGKGGDLFLLWLANGVLTLLTLGIYFAWGKVRLFKFFYSNIEFAGSRFRFTGTGKEIFLGALKALCALIPLYGALGLSQWASKAFGVPIFGFVSMAAFFAIFIFLSQYAVFASMRYRASRTRFREIAFRLDGDAWLFARGAFPRLLLVLVTLGIAAPLYTHWKIGRIYNNLTFGSLAFEWDAKAGEYWRMVMKGVFLSILTGGIYYFFWVPKWWAFVRGHLSVGGCRFRGDIKPEAFFLLTITNMLLVMCTLGIGAAWAMTRTMKFFLTRLSLEHPSRLEDSIQIARQKVAAGGEAIADAMDMDIGIGF